jgi:hypothetical protein
VLEELEATREKPAGARRRRRTIGLFAREAGDKEAALRALVDVGVDTCQFGRSERAPKERDHRVLVEAARALRHADSLAAAQDAGVLAKALERRAPTGLFGSHIGFLTRFHV